MLPGDKVTLDGKPVNWAKHNESGPKATATEHVYIKYWKPKGVVCTTDRTIKGNVIDEVCPCLTCLNTTQPLQPLRPQQQRPHVPAAHPSLSIVAQGCEPPRGTVVL